MKFKVGQSVLIIKEDDEFNTIAEITNVDVGDHPYQVKISGYRFRWYEEGELQKLDEDE